jgi:hypothetical protein
MKIIENKIIDVKSISKSNNAFFLRVEPENLNITVLEILKELSNVSWLNQFDKEGLKRCFEIRAMETSEYISKKLLDSTDESPIIENAGEYIVSVLAKKALVFSYKHNDIPLMELLGRKISNNPGFDFYTEKDNIITAGEAKYEKNVNAYNSSLKQIKLFIEKNKHIKDIELLYFFVPEKSIDNLNEGHFSVGAAFSTTNIKTDILIKNIKENKYFQDLIMNYSIFLLAVDIHE